MALKFKAPFGPGIRSSTSRGRKFKRQRGKEEEGLKRLKRLKQLKTPGQKTRRT